MLKNIPSENINNRTWNDLCKQTRLTAIALKRECSDKSRDPEHPIRNLLALDSPLTPIFNAMKKLRLIGDQSEKGSKFEALARRDELLLGLLLFNPLRATNIITLTYKVNNTGDILKDSLGVWHLRLSAGRMKNRKRLGNNVYKVQIPPWLGELFDNYVCSYRPVLNSGKSSNYFFFFLNGKRFNSMGRQFFKLTKSLIQDCVGFGPHSMRHLVATDWLTKNPNDFLTVSELLNDTLQVVINNYTHLKKNTSFSRWAEYLEGVRNAE
jgi:integrase